MLASTSHFESIIQNAPLPRNQAEIERLFTYPVPMLSEDGTCSLHEELAPEPFDLRTAIAPGSQHELEAHIQRLSKLNALMEHLSKETRADWVGIYRRVGEALVKEAYRGSPSRAIFPLTEEFSKKSNNVTAVLRGQRIWIHDVAEHVAQGGAYYECDPKVRSELCVPLFRDGSSLGLIDLESSQKGHFTPERVAWVEALCEFIVSKGLLG